MTAMTVPSDFVEEMTEDGVTALRFTGDLSIAAIGDLPERLSNYGEHVQRLDLSDIGYIDTVGAWLVHRTARDSGAEIVGGDNEAERLIAAVSSVDQPAEVRPDPPNPVVRVLDEVGEATMIALTTLAGLIGFFGSVMVSMGSLLRHPGRIRWNAVIQRFDVVGVRALGIIGLVGKYH